MMVKIGYIMASASLAAIQRVFEPEGAGWKVDDNGNILMKDGNPVYVDADGKEQTIAVNAISNLIGENRKFRSRAQEAEQALAAFDGIDAEKARDALDKIGKIDAKQLLDAGKVDEIRAEIEGRYKAQLTTANERVSSLESKLDSMALDTAFSTSKFVNERLAIPADLVRSAFGSNFKVEDGKLVPYGADGKPIYSNDKIGEVASFDEALSIIINGRPDKDRLLLAKPGNGSGNNGAGGNRGDGRVITRSEFDALPPLEKGRVAAEAGEGKLKIVD